MSTSPATDSPRFATVTKDDHSAWIIIATALGLACSLVFSFARVVVRHTTVAEFGLDDGLFACAVVFTIIESSVVLYGCSLGLGASMKSMTLSNQVAIQKVYYASILLWIIALGLSKVSLATLLRRINADSRRSIVFNAMVALLGVWTVAALFTLALQCDLGHPWITLHERCTNVALRWKIINALDILTELLLLAATIFIVWGLQTQFTRKAAIVAGFACRLPIIIIIGFRLATFHQGGLSTDPSLRETLFIVWTQTELCYSIISAAIPSLLQFMRSLNTHFGGLTDGENMTYGSHKKSSNSFPLSALRSRNKTDVSHNRSQTADESNVIYPGGAYTASAARQPPKSKDSLGSNDSQRMIIQKESTYTVEYE